MPLNPGPVAPKEQLIAIDISRIHGDKLRIKLESMTKLWKIDNIFVDYSEDAAVEVATALCESALTHDGREILDTLDNEDGIYYTTVRGDTAVLTFSELPRLDSYDKSYLVKARGYYETEMPHEGVAHSELVDDMLTEPLGVARYYLPKWLALETLLSAWESE